MMRNSKTTKTDQSKTQPTEVPLISSKAWGLLIILGFLWGGSFFFGHIAIQGLPTFTFVFLRVFIAALVLFPVLFIMKIAFSYDLRVWRAILVMSLFNNVIPFTFIALGLSQVPSGIASILNATVPFWTVILAHFTTVDEKINFHKFAGIILSTIGVVILIGLPLEIVLVAPTVMPVGGDSWFERISGFIHAHRLIFANLSFLVATLCYAISGIYAKRFKGFGVSPLFTTSYQSIFAAILILPLVIYFEQPWTMPMPNWQVVASIVALGVLSTAVAYILYYRILTMAGATVASLVTYLVPISALSLGMIILGELLSFTQVLGIVIIMSGLAAIDGRLLVYLRRKLNFSS